VFVPAPALTIRVVKKAKHVLLAAKGWRHQVLWTNVSAELYNYTIHRPKPWLPNDAKKACSSVGVFASDPKNLVNTIFIFSMPELMPSQTNRLPLFFSNRVQQNSELDFIGHAHVVSWVEKFAAVEEQTWIALDALDEPETFFHSRYYALFKRKPRDSCNWHEVTRNETQRWSGQKINKFDDVKSRSASHK